MIVLVTGSTDGHGRQVALDLAAAGHRVLVHGRDRSRGEEVVREAGPGASLFNADFASLTSVRALADEILASVDRIDVLVNNAGIASQARRVSADGVELTFAVNYLAHVALTERLLPALRAGAAPRIVNVASVGQAPIDFSDPMLERSYDGFRAYAQSKLAQIMWTFDLASELPADEMTVNALHPATLMDTTMVRSSFGVVRSSVSEGAEATERLVRDRAPEGVTGRYFEGTSEARAHPQAYDREARRRLRELTRELLDR